MRVPQLFLLGVLTSACARGEAAVSMGRVVVDSVAGVPRTLTELPTGWSDTNGWKLVEVARLTGGTDEPGELVNPGSIAIDAAGRIYVAERDPSMIKQFSPEGRYLRSIGRQGSGPGEFQTPFIAISGANLYVHDPQQSRTSLFDTAGAYVRSWPSSCCYWSPLEIDAEGHVGVPGPPPPPAGPDIPNPWQRTVRWFGADSVVADSTLVPSGPDQKYWTVRQGKRGMMSTTVPFLPVFKFGFFPDRRMVVGFGDHYELAITRHNGADTIARFGRSWTAAPVPEGMRKAEVARMIEGSKKWIDETLLRNTFLLADVPSMAPAFDWMGVDGQGDIWVRTPVPSDSTRTLFDIFDPQLRWLGQVSGSKYLGRWQAQLIGDRMVGQGEDEEGNPVVVVYTIQR